MINRVTIVEDHQLIASAIADMINHQDFVGFKVDGIYHNGKELIAHLDHASFLPEIILLDISMPVMDGYETASLVKEKFPEIRVLVLSQHDNEESIIKMIQRGAKGYLLKNATRDDLKEALTTIVTNDYYLDKRSRDYLINAIKEPKESESNLNELQLEFLKYAATEMSYQEIGDKMCKSHRTVEKYRDQLLQKFGLKTRIGLVVYAIKHGLIEL